MLSDKPEMHVALMCLEAGQQLKPHKAPLRLMMYCIEGRGTFIVGDEEVVADEKTAILCDPLCLTASGSIGAKAFLLW